MAREIKFRAKYFEEWYFGIIVTRKVKDKGRIRNIYILMGLDNENWIPLMEDQYDTIGQFTGLHDKNGKEIYEGDIIRTYGSKGDEIKHIVKYSDKEAMYCTKLIGADMLGGSITQRWLDEFEFEVIGNIYDNPELLKEDKV